MATIKGNICSQPGKQLFPAWENIVPWAGRKRKQRAVIMVIWSFGQNQIDIVKIRTIYKLLFIYSEQ